MKKVSLANGQVFVVPTGIVRIDAKKIDRKSQWHGWQVRLSTGSKFFSDSRFGGSKQALSAAKEYLGQNNSEE